MKTHLESHLSRFILILLWILSSAGLAQAQSTPPIGVVPDGWKFEILTGVTGSPKAFNSMATSAPVKKRATTVFNVDALKSVKNAGPGLGIATADLQTNSSAKPAGLDVDAILKYLIEANAIFPTGAAADPVLPQCRGEVLEEKLLQAGQNMDQTLLVINRYLRDCEQNTSRNNDRTFYSLLKEDLIQYDVMKLQGRLPFRLTTPTNEILQGIILQNKPGPRPWVVLKCGVFCEVPQDARSLNVIMHLFDEAPFNVMAINNDVSPASILDNQRVHVGGLYEGQSLFRAAYWLKHISPFKDQVSAVHGMGISLGGSASLYASLYNDYNLVESKKVFNSFIAYCPVVNTGPTLQDIFAEGLKGFLFGYKTWDLIQEIYPYVDDVRRRVSLDRKPKASEYPGLLGGVSVDYLSRKSFLEFLKPFQMMKPIGNANELWEVNHFSSLAYGMQTPTLVLASDDDWVVKPSLNSNDLAEKFNHDPNTNIRVVNMKFGNHCGSSLVYGWGPISKLIRGYFMAHSAAETESSDEASLPLHYSRPTFSSSDIIADYEWVPSLSQNTLNLVLKVWSSRYASFECTRGTSSLLGRPPQNRNPYTSDRSCYTNKTLKLNYNDFKALGLKKPQDEVSLQSLRRYMNANFSPVVNGRTVVGERRAPDAIQVKDYIFKLPVK